MPLPQVTAKSNQPAGEGCLSFAHLSVCPPPLLSSPLASLCTHTPATASGPLSVNKKENQAGDRGVGALLSRRCHLTEDTGGSQRGLRRRESEVSHRQAFWDLRPHPREAPDTQDPGPSFSLAQPPKVQDRTGGQGSGVGPALRHRGTEWDSVFLGQEGAQASLNTEAMRGRRAANPPNPVLGVGWGGVSVVNRILLGFFIACSRIERDMTQTHGLRSHQGAAS